MNAPAFLRTRLDEALARVPKAFRQLIDGGCRSLGRRIRAGKVSMKTFMNGCAELPFGGYGQSGLGRELGRGAVEDYTEAKTLHLHHGPRTSWWTEPMKAVA